MSPPDILINCTTNIDQDVHKDEPKDNSMEGFLEKTPEKEQKEVHTLGLL